MRTLLYFLLPLVFTFILFSCGDSETDAVETATETTAIPAKEPQRKSPPVPQPAPSDLKEGLATKSDESTETLIADIREKYAAVTTKKESNLLRKDSLGFECESGPGGGTLLRYYDGDDLVLLHHSAGGEHSWESDRVYFSAGKPFFVFHEEGYWQFGGPLNEDGNPNTIDKIMEERLYLKDGKVLKALDKSYDIKSWEEPVKSENVPNRAVPELVGEEYEKAKVLGEWIAGEVGC